MMGILVKNPANIFGDKELVLVNSSIPDSLLEEKSIQLFTILFVWIYAGQWRMAYIKNDNNVVNILTKPLGDGE